MSQNRSPKALRVVATATVALLTLAAAASAQFRRGDADGDGIVDNDDATRILDAIFGSNPLDCEDAGDANDDGMLDQSDAIFVLNFVNLNGAAPAAPGAYECDTDPTADFLGCTSYDAPCVNFRRGDADGDGDVDPDDVNYMLDALFLPNGPDLECLDAADANDDGSVTIADAVYLTNFFYQGGAAPPSPGPADCGPDATATDSIDCGSYVAACNEFLRGDANSDGSISLADASTIFSFPGNITCDDAADANDDGQIDAADGNYILDYLFRQGPLPPFPGPTQEGRDVLTPDLLGCD